MLLVYYSRTGGAGTGRWAGGSTAVAGSGRTMGGSCFDNTNINIGNFPRPRR